MEIHSDESLSAKDLLDSESSNSTKISYDKLQEYPIIINNNDCGDSFFQTICGVLLDDDFPIQIQEGPLTGGFENSIIVTLDMQYSAGEKTLLFVPIDNTRVGYSDSLVLSMKTGLEEVGMRENSIICGQVGFQKDENGVVHHIVPTPTEKVVSPSSNTDFVTISFGTSNVEPTLVAKAIESGLLRHIYYLNHFDLGSDLIYKTNPGEEIDVVANYFGSSIKELCEVNHMKGLDALEEKAIVNPHTSQMEVFHSNVSFQLEKEKEKTY